MTRPASGKSMTAVDCWGADVPWTGAKSVKEKYWSYRICISHCKGCQVYVETSIGHPDPQDPHIFGPPGSGSISQRYGFGSGSGSGSFAFLIKVLSGLK